MNGTLYPFGARLRDGCTVYECQKRDNCGKFVPVEWGKFCRSTEVYNIKTSVSIFFSKSDLPKKVFLSIQFSSKHLFRLLKLSILNCLLFVTRLLLGGQMLWTRRQMEVRSRLFYFHLQNVPEIKWRCRHGSSKRHRYDDHLQRRERTYFYRKLDFYQITSI